MTSNTKSTISIDQIQDIFRHRFPDCEIISIDELTEGLFNRAYAIICTKEFMNGVVVKFGTQPGITVLTNEIVIMLTEIAVYELLKSTTIPIPKVYVSDTSKEIVNCDYIIMDKLSGITWKSIQNKLEETTRESLLYDLGYMTATFHSIKGPHFGYIHRNCHIEYSSWGAAF